MSQLSLWLWGIVRHIVLAIVGAVVGGAIIVWLKRRGIDLEGQVLDFLDLASSPENITKALIALLILAGVLFSLGIYFARRVVNIIRRPPLGWVQRMRGILADVQEDCLNVVPNELRAEDALRRFRVVRSEIPVGRKLGSILGRIEHLTNEYLTRVSPGYRGGDEEADGIHTLRELALAAVLNFMRQTSWAVTER
jgi:hypothetical protein